MQDLTGERQTVTRAVAPLHARPDADSEQVSQALFGETAVILETTGPWAHVRLLHDGYEGWILQEALAPGGASSTHRVAVPRTFLFSAPDIKSRPLSALFMGSPVEAAETENPRFKRIVLAGTEGFVIASHLRERHERLQDPAAVALMFLHAPYLWGGRTVAGIDCSGLVQTALRMCGLANVPRDSGDQMQQTGLPLDPGAVSGGGLRRGDLVFWKGHVAMALDAETIVHANAHHMMVARESLREAIARIRAGGGGEVLAARRPVLPGDA
jgi:cell wall-associated NlpC family hydrolase